MARVNRFSETIAELLPMLLPSIDKLLIWEHKAKEKGANLCSGKCRPLRIACRIAATAAVK